MTAFVRDVSVGASEASIPSWTINPPQASEGMMMLAFLAADNGIGQLISISGGWTLLTRIFGPVGTLSAVDVWHKVAGANEQPYTITQAPTADGVAVIVSIGGAADGLPQVEPGFLYSSTSSVTTPSITPNKATGLELRWSGGVPPPPFTSVTWQQPPGFTEVADVQSQSVVTGSLCSRQIVSSADTGQQIQSSSALLQYAAGITVVIASAEVQIPDPPTFPSVTPARGETRMRYTVHDLLTGAYRGDLKPFGVVLDRRLGEPGTWRGRLSLVNTSEARKIGEIFPADPLDLLSGPGRLVVHTWRSGVLWGIHWLHTIVTSKDQRGSVWMDVQGSTLDAYLMHVALEQDVAFSGDQITAARQLIAHMQATSGSNIGLALQTGTSGVNRLLTAKASDNTTYGRILQDYARQAAGFESVVNPRVVDGVIFRSWEWGSPKIIGSGVHVFAEGQEGGDITTWREERSALRGGTRWRVIGGTPQQDDATTSSTAMRSVLVATPHLEEGWPIIDQRPTHPGQSVDQTTLDDYAAYWASRAPGAPPVFSADVVIGKSTTLDPNGLGDSITYKLNNPRWPITADGAASFNRTQRLIGWELTPAERDSGGKDKVKLITEAEVP
ncbi:hypothetical protein [Nonomuraea sp. bgisy094]